MQSFKIEWAGGSQPAQPASSDDADLTSPANLRKLVLNYLLHHCYTETATAFAKDGIIGDLYGGESSMLPISADDVGASSTGARPAVSSASASGSRSSAATIESSVRTPTASNGGARQAHPLSAPPLSRDDSSMEIEVENLLPTSSEHADASASHHREHSNGLTHSNGHSAQARNGAGAQTQVHDDDEDLEDAELAASEFDEVQEDFDIDVSPDLTAEDLRGVRARKQIKDYIISGQIRQAMDMINEHFPTVLNSAAAAAAAAASGSSNGSKSTRSKTGSSAGSAGDKMFPANPTSMEPDHLLLNLQIQVFIEAIRSASSAQLAPSSTAQLSASNGGLPSLATTTPGIAASAISRAASPAPSTSSSNGSATSATGTNAALNPALHSALAYAQGLYASAQKLPSFWRAMYLKELEQVTALLAYTDVEHSPVRRFLHRSRKVALAEQVNSAILLRCGKPSQPLIEVAVRQTTLLWDYLQAEEVQVPIGHPVWGLVQGGNGGVYEGTGAGKKGTKRLPDWKFRSFLQER
ncbi:LisH motif-containing protein [Pseudozyma hubeiensis SY62]|uniref:LisH motif-containing protein n=1 Tax=Pseudozyma hubeiensis (strain SY62) TaxID=1305764 RepID=R9PBZ3_PSEHS|nr:LisH motif-containing protein [Pseudozyma hubeiensis SY62]GAC95610.1 LisH motif-containing protein [Pseudozyma hubeiensis SY62]